MEGDKNGGRDRKSARNRVRDRYFGPAGESESNRGVGETEKDGVSVVRGSNEPNGAAVHPEAETVGPTHSDGGGAGKRASRANGDLGRDRQNADAADQGHGHASDDSHGGRGDNRPDSVETRLAEEVRQKFKEDQAIFGTLATPADPIAPEMIPAPKKRGRKKKDPSAKQAQAALEDKTRPLSSEELDRLVTSIGLVYDLLDMILWRIGLNTDPELPAWPPQVVETPTGEKALMPGKAIWHLDDDTIRSVHLKVFLSRSNANPVLNAQARVLIAAMEYYRFGLITLRQLSETIWGLVDGGFHLRVMSKEAFVAHVDRYLFERGLTNETV